MTGITSEPNGSLLVLSSLIKFVASLMECFADPRPKVCTVCGGSIVDDAKCEAKARKISTKVEFKGGNQVVRWL